ncbi:MAG: F0F1 ATP synthase subunit A, partial [Sphingomonadales bacterium]|nr:F0F1 ATP synthase subunit A [Sphingomonadales bacterium]
MAHSPLAQFEIKPLVPMEIAGHDVSFTNSSLFMVAIVILLTLFMNV